MAQEWCQKTRSYWENGYKDGNWKYWYDTGAMIKEEILKMGK